jgi:squalene-hopene/tetraprenyl-beta-curcumene cyclase
MMNAIGSLPLFSGLLVTLCFATTAPSSETLEETRQTMVDRAVAFLQTTQAADGSFSSHAGIGPTAIVVTALLESGVEPSDPTVRKGLTFLEKYVQPDGGIYNPDLMFRNYETSLAMVAMVKANDDGRYDEKIAGAERFVKKLQWDESEGKSPDDLYYGGAGYGSHERPDMSNTQFLIESLQAAGNGPEDDAIQKALVFVSRCQNLETEHNPTPFASKNPDGGFYYTCANGGESKAGETPNGGLRSYASMTYAGLKSMIYAGVDQDDPRVTAAYDWARKHYDLSVNPGLGKQGLYYYYQVMAKALDAMELEILTEEDGTRHRWRADLIEHLAEKQQPEGYWVNDETRWLEGDANLVTGYVLLTLAHCK